MIWSNKHLGTEFRNLKRAGLLQNTTALESEFVDKSIPHDPVHYVVVPPSLHQVVKKIVVPYVHLNEKGFLVHPEQSFYAVTQRPDTGAVDKQAAIMRSQEAHVVAEDLALRRGIFTLYARAHTEHLVAKMIPELYREGYVDDRIAHIGALREDALAHQDELTQRQFGTLDGELERGIDALDALKA